MAKRPTIPIPDFSPDLSDLGTGVSQNILGVVPRGDGYGPFQALLSFTQGLPAPCQGYFFARNVDGSISVFAGTSTKLYLLDNTTFGWIDVSKGSTTYSALSTGANWQFDQFNQSVLATQANDVVQSYVLGSSSAFADLAGSPPQAANIAIVNFFVVLTGLLSNPNRIQWSDLDGITTWTAGIGQSDYQDLPDGGNCHGISGGDAFGLIFQDSSIRSLIYAPGSGVVFDIVRVSTQDSLFGAYSIINSGPNTFYCSAQGFRMIQPGGVPIPIGKERVDRWFFANVDPSALGLLIGATDPSATRVYWAFKSQAGAAGLFDTILCFDWSIGASGKWSVISQSGQYLAALARPGLTLHQLDAIAPGALTVTGAADNGAGLIRLTLNEESNTFFTIVGQNFIVVQGVVGTVEANGRWSFNIIDGTHIDLLKDEDGNSSAFVHAYVDGGAIGGSLDALPFSLDSVSTGATARLSAVSAGSAVGFFDGANVEAIMETDEQDLEGDLVFIDAVRPITDASAALISIGGRLNAQAAVTYSAESAMSGNGDCPQLVETRYARAKLRIPAGATWTYARAIQPSSVPAGDA
jgi:hypothetical protein